MLDVYLRLSALFCRELDKEIDDALKSVLDLVSLDVLITNADIVILRTLPVKHLPPVVRRVDIFLP